MGCTVTLVLPVKCVCGNRQASLIWVGCALLTGVHLG